MPNSDWLALGILVGCASPDPDRDARRTPPETFQCELGALGPESAYLPLTDHGDVELVLGFQGFLFVRLAVKTDAPPEVPCRAVTSLTVEGMQPSGGEILGLTFEPDDLGRFQSNELILYLPGASVAAFTGEEVNFAVRVEDATRSCVVEQTATLVDDDPCIHSGAEPICPGDSADTGLP